MGLGRNLKSARELLLLGRWCTMLTVLHLVAPEATWFDASSQKTRRFIVGMLCVFDFFPSAIEVLPAPSSLEESYVVKNAAPSSLVLFHHISRRAIEKSICVSPGFNHTRKFYAFKIKLHEFSTNFCNKQLQFFIKLARYFATVHFKFS